MLTFDPFNDFTRENSFIQQQILENYSSMILSFFSLRDHRLGLMLLGLGSQEIQTQSIFPRDNDKLGSRQ